MSVGTAIVRVGTRGSALALTQAGLVVAALGRAGVAAETVTIETAGDRRLPDTAWGEGAFVTAIESALLDGTVDVAVHSAKDVPTDEDRRLAIAAFLPRADPADAIVVGRTIPGLASLDDLPRGARVGTDSPRRGAFLRARRPDLRIHPLHGNVDTRLRRLDAGETDALVLACAGLQRLGRDDRISLSLPPSVVPPAPGQGALAVQVRANDAATRLAVAALDDPLTRAAVLAERALLSAAGGGCRAPIGALAVVRNGVTHLLGGYARADGSIVAIAERSGPSSDPDGLAALVLADIAGRATALARDAGWPRVLVTRAADQLAPTALALVDRGLTPVAVPAIARARGDEAALRDAAERLATFDWVVLTSAAAVTPLVAAIGVDPSERPRGVPRWAAVGASTTRAARGAGIEVAFRSDGSSAASLAEELPVRPGERVLLARSDLADERLPNRLRGRGAVVETVVAYRTVEAPAASLPLLQAALDDQPAAVICTSGSSVRGLIALARAIGPAALDATMRLPAVTIGGETSAVAVREGFTVAASASEPTPASIAAAAATALGNPPGASMTLHPAPPPPVGEPTRAPVPPIRTRRLRRSPALRALVRETRLDPAMLIAPLFVRPGLGRREPVGSMPGVERLSPDEAAHEAAALARLGVGGVILFGLPETKDATGTAASLDDGIVQQALRSIRDLDLPLALIADTCLCEYTDHGHCGPLAAGGGVDNDATLARLAETAVSQAAAGADIVAPSAMADGQVAALRSALDAAGHVDTAVMAYASKTASAFYGPFREAADSAPAFGDRRAYQMDPANGREAVREMALDVAEGADLLLVKPGLPCLDLIAAARERFDVPVAAYQVSGEYAMVQAAAERGWIDGRRAMTEAVTSIVRAGAGIVITYAAADLARWIADDRSVGSR